MRLRIGSRNILCVDWGQRSLRVVDAGLSRSGVRIRKAVYVPLAEGINVRDPAAMGDFLRRTLAEHRIRTRRAIVDIPRQDAVLHQMFLPEGSADELAAMVNIQVAKELPFSKDQAVIDFAVTHEEGGKTCEVWVAAVRNNILDYYRQVIITAGLKLERIGLRPYANLEALAASGLAEGRTLMVDVGSAMTEINVTHDKHLVYSRSAWVLIPAEGLTTAAETPQAPAAPQGGEATIPLADDFAPKPSSMDALLVEVSRTIEAYRATDPGAKIDRIVLAGTVGIDQKVLEVFQERFALPTSLYEAPPSLCWRVARDVSAAPFSAVLGLALSSMRESTLHFDFLHPKEPEAGRRERAKRRPMLAATIALFVSAAVVLAYQPVRQRNIQVDQLKAQIKELNKDEKQRKELMKQLGDVKAWQSRNVAWIDELKRLADVFPSNKECYITELEFRDSGLLVIELVATNNKVATKLAKAVAELKDDKGKRIFDARPGNVDKNKKDPKYSVKDKVLIQIKSLEKKKKSKKRR